jgi:hypothetical protein
MRAQYVYGADGARIRTEPRTRKKRKEAARLYVLDRDIITALFVCLKRQTQKYCFLFVKREKYYFFTKKNILVCPLLFVGWKTVLSKQTRFLSD